jgi:ATP-binding cassette subfamily B multidrug efflux pump
MARRVTAHTFDRISSLYARMTEHMAGIRVIRSMGLIPWFSGRLTGLSVEIAANSRRSAMLSIGQSTLQELLSLAIFVAFLWWIGWRVTTGTMSINDALLLPAGLLMIREESSALSGGIMSLRKAEGAAMRLSQVLAEEPEPTGTVELPSALDTVALDGVTFGYPSREPVIQSMSLVLRPGGLTILLGDSGSGKSTVCDLCLRFRRPSSGRITYNGADLAFLTEQAVRSSTALVEQEPYLFEGTVFENLLPGFSGDRNEAKDAEVWDSLTRADAAGFVRDLQGGLDAKLLANGGNLSVGQKQRLALARAMLRHPRFLILDEFTSNLDTATEARIIETIAAASRDIIVLCTTHRLSLLPYARDIYCIQNGGLQRLAAVPH